MADLKTLKDIREYVADADKQRENHKTLVNRAVHYNTRIRDIYAIIHADSDMSAEFLRSLADPDRDKNEAETAREIVIARLMGEYDKDHAAGDARSDW